MNRLLEIACFNFSSAVTAQEAGADRVELCSAYENGGLSPSRENIERAVEKLKIPIHVMIRPRSGNFVYSLKDTERMKEEIEFCRKSKVTGIVIGALTASDDVDHGRLKDFLDLAGDMRITFHRAIDECRNMKAAMERLIDLGVGRVLCSGGPGNAIDNLERLKILQKNYGHRIIIMPAGNIRAANISDILKTGCREYHSSALRANNLIPDPTEIRLMKQTLARA
jgi:copper homeostasis protein